MGGGVFGGKGFSREGFAAAKEKAGNYSSVFSFFVAVAVAAVTGYLGYYKVYRNECEKCSEVSKCGNQNWSKVSLAAFYGAICLVGAFVVTMVVTEGELLEALEEPTGSVVAGGFRFMTALLNALTAAAAVAGLMFYDGCTKTCKPGTWSAKSWIRVWFVVFFVLVFVGRHIPGVKYVYNI